METIGPDGSVRPGGGTLTVYEAPNGPGVRTDGFGYAGYRTSGAFDSLLAKVIVHARRTSPGPWRGPSRALSEFRLEGVATNIAVPPQHPGACRTSPPAHVHTRWVDEHMAALVADGPDQRRRFVEAARPAASDGGFAGARVKSRDPLALFAHDAQVKAEQATADVADEAVGARPDPTARPGSPRRSRAPSSPSTSPIGDEVRQGQQVAVVEAMKMEHVITAPHGGIVRGVTMAPGDVVREGYPDRLHPGGRGRGRRRRRRGGTRTRITSATTCARTYDRHAFGLDENRPDAVARRRKLGYRMPRENIDRLVDPGSFKEYWPLVVARQHQRNTIEALRKNTPGDGVVAGMCVHQRHAVRRDALPRRRRALRLHRAGGHAGAPQPLQAGPDVRAGAALQAADRSCSARAAAAGRARTTSAPASRSIRTRSRPSRS